MLQEFQLQADGPVMTERPWERPDRRAADMGGDAGMGGFDLGAGDGHGSRRPEGGRSVSTCCGIETCGQARRKTWLLQDLASSRPGFFKAWLLPLRDPAGMLKPVSPSKEKP
jgi:hypothetical protein